MKLIIALAVVQKWGDYMKAVLLSIKPQYCYLIANGEKTIEVRKTAPKLKPFFKCYIYCTKAKPIMGRGLWRDKEGTIRCDVFEPYEEDEFDIYNKDNLFKANGKVIGEFICDKIYDCDADSEGLFDKETKKHLPESCLDWKTIFLYTKGTLPLYGWQISDLIIYDKPKELSEFRKPGGRQCVSDNGRCCKYIQASPGDDPADANTMSCIYGEQNCPFEHLNRPPQSWCYVGESNNECTD